jgi:hypothetical protein
MYEQNNRKMSSQMYSLTLSINQAYYPLKLSPIKSNIQMPILPEINIKNSIVKCVELEQTIRNAVATEVDTECPICFTQLGDTNCVIPLCGHKTCIPCFIQNIKYNQQTGDCCVLCRKKYD